LADATGCVGKPSATWRPGKDAEYDDEEVAYQPAQIGCSLPEVFADNTHPKSPKGRASVKSPKIAKKAVDGLSRSPQSRSKLVESLFHRETKPGSRRSGPGPENQIPIPIPNCAKTRQPGRQHGGL
jgi:hypothetical protein